MTGEPQITVTGNLTADPEGRTTQSGTPVLNYTVASTPRRFNNGQWEDGETLFMKCTQWQGVEQAAQSLSKGMRVIVTGNLKSRSWQDKNTGANRTEPVLEVQEVGPSLKYAVAQVRKVDNRQQGGNQGGQAQQRQYDPQPGAQNPNSGGWGNQAQGGQWNGQQAAQPPQQPQGQPPAQQDPWASSSQFGGGGGANNNGWTDPPF